MLAKYSKTIFYILFIGIVFVFLYLVRNILLPFILSAFLAYIIAPLIIYLESFGIKKSLVIILLYTFCLFIFIGSLVLLIPTIVHQVSTLTEKLPEYTIQIKNSIANLQQDIETKYPVIKQKGLIDTALQKAQLFFNQELTKIPGYLMNLFSVFSLLVLIPFITYFFLMDSGKIFDKFFQILPARYVETVLSLICEFDEAIGKFLRIQFIEATFVGILATMGLLILNVNYAVLIGIIAGLGNMIPYLGPVVGAIPAMIIGLIQYSNPIILIKIIILFAIVQFLDNTFLQPILISKGVQLHPVVIIFSIMAGAQIGGVLGMFFAVPVAAIVKVTINILQHSFFR